MKILIFCLPGIGDALMSTPMIKLLKKKLPQSRIDVACMFEGVKYVFKNNRNIHTIFKLSLYNENKFTGIKQLLALRKEKYDISFLTLPAYRREYHFAQWFVHAKKRVAHRFKVGYWSECNFLDTHLVGVDESKHNVINNLKLLKALGIDWRHEVKLKDIRYDLILDKNDIEFGLEWMDRFNREKDKVVAIHPGSTLSPAALLRRWPIKKYAVIIRYLLKEKGNKVLIFVGPDEADLGVRLYELIDDHKNCKLIYNLKFHQALGILNKCDALICNDNGFGHIANSLNIPLITLWSSTNDHWSLPYRKDLVVLIRPKNFKPWYRYDLKRSVPKSAKSGMDKIQINTVRKIIENNI